MFVDFAVFHYELDVFQQANIRERVAGDGDDVGVLARLDRAEFVWSVRASQRRCWSRPEWPASGVIPYFTMKANCFPLVP